MKPKVLLLLLTLFFSYFGAFAQTESAGIGLAENATYLQQHQSFLMYDINQEEVEMMRLPIGKYCRKANKRLYSGIVLASIGTIFANIGFAYYNKYYRDEESNPNNEEDFGILIPTMCGVFAAAGIGSGVPLIIMGIIGKKKHCYDRGEDETFYLNSGQDGIGLAFRF